MIIYRPQMEKRDKIEEPQTILAASQEPAAVWLPHLDSVE